MTRPSTSFAVAATPFGLSGRGAINTSLSGPTGLTPLLGLLLQEAGPQFCETLFARRAVRAGIGEELCRQGRRTRRAIEWRRRNAQTAVRSARACQACLLFLGVGPVEEGGDDLEDLELLGIGAVQGEEVQEVIGNNLSDIVSGNLTPWDKFRRSAWQKKYIPINVVLWLGLLQEAQRFG